MSWGEFLNEARKDKWLKWPLRFLVFAALIAFVWGFIDYKIDSADGKHAKFLWWERNIPKGYPDTVWQTKIEYRDTSYNKSGKLSVKHIKDNATIVESHNQKGGQTASNITNN